MSGRTRALSLGVLVTLLWSSSWLLIRWGDARSFDPVALAAARYVLAAGVLVGIAVVRHRSELRALLHDHDALRHVAARGVTYYALTQAAQFIAIVHQPAATTSLLLSGTVIVVAVLSRAVLAEPLPKAVPVGAAVVVVGSALYSLGDLGFSGVGIAAATVALLGNSAATLLGRRVSRDHAHHPIVLTSVSMAIGAVALVAFAALTHRPLPHVDAATAGVIGWMGLINTAAAFSVWTWVLRHVTAAQAAGINNLMLVEIAGLGWIALGEGLGPIDIAAISLTTAGVALTQRRNPLPPPHNKHPAGVRVDARQTLPATSDTGAASSPVRTVR
jgi:drug/metabolite transporter (DMT)-like permease